MKKILLVCIASILLCNGYSQNLPSGKKLIIKTTLGDIKVLLYDETPLHRDNFIKLATTGVYDSVLFHRVIKNFMIQTGDPDSKHALAGKQLGTGGPGYTVQAEINPKFYHKKGALAAARQGDQVNPQKRSSGSQFYIVVGEVFSLQKLQVMEQNVTNKMKKDFYKNFMYSVENADLMSRIHQAQTKNDTATLKQINLEYQTKFEEAWSKNPPFKYSPELTKIYTTIGGTPHLDNEYTVFGEVIDGMDVVGRINNTITGQADRPVEDIRIISAKLLP